MTAIVFKMMVIVSSLLGAGALRWPGLATMPERRFLAMTLGIQVIPGDGRFHRSVCRWEPGGSTDVPGTLCGSASAAGIRGGTAATLSRRDRRTTVSAILSSLRMAEEDTASGQGVVEQTDGESSR
jgi:hypothetical protein